MDREEEFSRLLGGIFQDIVQARVAADAFTAELARKYQGDELMRHFPVPRLDISSMNIELRFAFGEHEPKSGQYSLIVKAEELRELDPATISTISFSLNTRNMTWIKNEKGDLRLIESH